MVRVMHFETNISMHKLYSDYDKALSIDPNDKDALIGKKDSLSNLDHSNTNIHSSIGIESTKPEPSTQTNITNSIAQPTHSSNNNNEEKILLSFKNPECGFTCTLLE